MGIDVVGVFARKTMFGFPADQWKTWMFHGLEVLIPGNFNVTVDDRGDTLIYPKATGRRSQRTHAGRGLFL